MKRLIVVFFGVSLGVTGVQAFPASAASPDRAYWQELERICETGPTREAAEAWEEFVAALAREATIQETQHPLFGRRKFVWRTTDGPHGKTTNLWSPRSPDHAYVDCVQAR